MPPWLRVAIAHQLYAWAVLLFGIVITLGYGFQDKADWPILVRLAHMGFWILWLTATFPFYVLLVAVTETPGPFTLPALIANSLTWRLLYRRWNNQRNKQNSNSNRPDPN